MKYVIYARKSTEGEDRQVLSLDAQERELLEIAAKYNLKVIETFRESMSAKAAGRPVFEQMLYYITSGKADAILCWKLDRLARNFFDAGVQGLEHYFGILFRTTYSQNTQSFVLRKN